jgi:hypothetical protein
MMRADDVADIKDTLADCPMGYGLWSGAGGPGAESAYSGATEMMC